MLNLHKFTSLHNCHTVIDLDNKNMKMKDFLKLNNETKYDKSFADIWEALASVIILDGGYQAFSDTYGKIMDPFIFYYLKNPEMFY